MNPIEKRLERIEVDETVDVPNTTGTGVAEKITVKVPAWRDPKDGEIYLDADAIALLDKAKARHLGVLAPQQLALLRRRLGLTQKEIGELLQIGEKTWCRWETGRERPSQSLNLLLLALYDGQIDLAYLRNKLAAKTISGLQPILKSFTPDLLASGFSTWTQIPTTLGLGCIAPTNYLQAHMVLTSAPQLAAWGHLQMAMPQLPAEVPMMAGNIERCPMAA